MDATCSRIRLTAGALVAGMLLLGVARLMDVEHVSGTLSATAPDMIAVTVETDTQMFAVSGVTMASLDGQPARMADLRQGDSVNVAAQSPGEDGLPLAMRVDAIRNRY